jgi:hypothetical protein
MRGERRDLRFRGVEDTHGVFVVTRLPRPRRMLQQDEGQPNISRRPRDALEIGEVGKSAEQVSAGMPARCVFQSRSDVLRW